MQILWQPLTNLWQQLINLLINLLIVFYHFFNNLGLDNLGLAIIVFTTFIRLLLVPLTTPSMRAMQKMKDFAPELERLKRKHAGDRTRLMQAQADFYKEKGINPASGCLPQIVQLVILIALFNGFYAVFQVDGNITEKLNAVLYQPLKLSGEVKTQFLWGEVTKPDVIRVSGLPFPLPGFFLVLSALVQFLSSKMMAPQAVRAEKEAKQTSGGLDDVMAQTQSQMFYLFPILTLVIGYTFPLALVIYWTVFSLFQVVQQYLISGWGGLSPWAKRLGLLKSE